MLRILFSKTLNMPCKTKLWAKYKIQLSTLKLGNLKLCVSWRELEAIGLLLTEQNMNLDMFCYSLGSRLKSVVLEIEAYWTYKNYISHIPFENSQVQKIVSLVYVSPGW